MLKYFQMENPRIPPPWGYSITRSKMTARGSRKKFTPLGEPREFKFRTQNQPLGILKSKPVLNCVVHGEFKMNTMISLRKGWGRNKKSKLLARCQNLWPLEQIQPKLNYCAAFSVKHNTTFTRLASIPERLNCLSIYKIISSCVTKPVSWYIVGIIDWRNEPMIMF